MNWFPIPTRPALLLAFSALAWGPVAWGAGDLDKAQAAWAAGELRTATIALKDLLQRDPSNAQARMLLARVYLDLAQGAAAEQELERAAAAGVPRSDFQVLLADALLIQGENTRALDAAQTQGAVDPAQAATLLAQRGEAYLGLADPQAAGLAFAQALERRPGLTRALLGQAKLAMTQEGPERAAALIQQALDSDPKAASAWEMRGDLDQARGRFADAAEAYTQALAASRNSWMLSYKRALARTELGAFDEAAADIADAQAGRPQFSGVHYARGYLLFKQGKPDQALVELEQFLRALPDNPRAIYFAGVSAYQAGQLQQAEEYLSRFHAAAPKATEGAKALGLVRIGRKDFKGAEAVLAPFAKAQDPDPEILRAYSRALAGLGRAVEVAQVLGQAAQRQPQEAAPRLELVNHLLSSGKAETAVTEVRMLLQQAPDNRTARLLLVKALLLSGQAQAALSEAQALERSAPGEAEVYNALALALLANGQEPRARAALAKALELRPGLADAALNLANLEVKAKHLDAARGLYEQILAHDPANTMAILALVQLDISVGDKKGAVQRLDGELRRNPGDLVLRTNLATGYLHGGRAEEALGVLRDAPPDQVNDPGLLLLRGQAVLGLRRWSDAVAAFDQLARVQPGTAGPQLLLATALAGAGNRTGMEEHLLDGVKIDANNPLVPATMARVIAALPDAEARAALVEKLATAMGDHPQVALTRAELAIEQRDYAKAIDYLRGQHKLRPKDPAIFDLLLRAQMGANRLRPAAETAEAWLRGHPEDDRVRAQLAQIYLRNGDHDAAVTAYRAILTRKPDDAFALNNLAMVLQDKDPVQAMGHAERAYALRPKDPAIADTLGSLLLAQHQNARAAEVLSTAFAAMPGNGTVSFHYASALAAVGKTAEARRILLELSQKQFPEQAQAQALLTRLSGAQAP